MGTFFDRVQDLEPGEYPSDEGTYRTASGQLFRVVAEPDYDVPLEDAEDSYGRVEYRDDRDARRARPEGFDGAARKIDLRNGFLWWQPPADAIADPHLLGTMRAAVRDIAEYGYKVATVELLAPEPDHYGRPIVVNAASVGGIEPFDEIGHLVRDLIGELELDI